MDGFGKNKRVAICHGKTCSKRGSPALGRLLDEEIAAQGLCEEVSTRPGACNDLCDHGPSMVVHPDRIWYAHLTPDAVRRIVREHLAGGRPVREYIAKDKGEKAGGKKIDLKGLFPESYEPAPDQSEDTGALTTSKARKKAAKKLAKQARKEALRAAAERTW